MKRKIKMKKLLKHNQIKIMKILIKLMNNQLKSIKNKLWKNTFLFTASI